MLAAAAAGCTQATQTKTNLTAQEVSIRANQVLNDAENHVAISENERWNISYQTVSVRKPTAQEMANWVNLKAEDWLLDVRVTMIHEYFKSGLWVTPPTNPVSYKLARYTYISAANKFQTLDQTTGQ